MKKVFHIRDYLDFINNKKDLKTNKITLQIKRR